MKHQKLTPSTQSRLSRLLTLAIAAGCVALQVGRRLDLALLATVVWLVALVLLDRQALRRLFMPKFWTIFIIVALGSGLFLGPRDIDVAYGLRVSAQGLEAGALMVLRGIFIFSMVSWLARAIEGSAVNRIASRVGLGNLSTAVSTAFAALPALRDELAERQTATKGGSFRKRLGKVRRTMVDALAETARLSDRFASDIEGGPRARLVVITGGKGAGKTTTITNLAEQLGEQGMTVGGVAQPALERKGQRTGYELVDVGSGDQRPFARRKTEGRGFDFEESGWAWAADRVTRAKAENNVVFVDELGLLESEGEGHMPGLLSLAREPGQAALLCAAVREGCLSDIETHLGEAALVIDAPLDDADVEKTAQELATMVQNGRDAIGAAGND